MSEKKQTSVDVLFEILWECPRDKWEWNAVLKEIREIHKQEIINAWVIGCDNGYDKACDNITWEEMDSAKDNYYTNTFE